MDIPRHWRLRKQRYRLEGIENVDQKNGIGLAHMSSSPEMIEAIKKRRALWDEQEKKDQEALVNVRNQIEEFK
jgi:hypothetical protein